MSVDLITIGESFADLIFFDLPRIPGAGEEVKTNSFARTAGGGVIITAVTAARLELRCSVVAAAREGQFFKVFARVHPTKHFPHISLLTLGIISIPFCFFTLGQLVSWLIQVQILLRFSWQCLAAILLYEYRKDIPHPFKMWLYPVPALFSLGLWLYIFVTGPWEGIVFSVLFLLASVAAYFAFEKMRRRAPLGN